MISFVSKRNNDGEKKTAQTNYINIDKFDKKIAFFDWLPLANRFFERNVYNLV